MNRFLLALGALLLGIVIVTHARAADELCPDMETGKRETPTDVAGVQADIERLNLCVERAKLLKQLDDVAQQRTETLNKVNNPGMDMGGMGVNVIPSLPTSSLPSLPDIRDTSSGKVQVKSAAANPFENAASAVAPVAAGPSVWKIRKIWGQAGGVSGAVMRAQLSDGKGNLLNVVKGDPLPDGQVVESVSIRGVTLSQSSSKGSGKINDLSWEEAGASTSAGAGSPISVPLTP